VTKPTSSALSTVRLTLLLALSAAGCESANNPASPSTSPQVGGDWNYTLRLNSVAGGECVGTILQTVVGTTDSGALNIVQTGSSLSATLGDATTGTCTYAGSVSNDSMTLNLTRCDGGSVLASFPCLNGALRDIEYVNNTITASVSGNSANGSSVETYNIYTASTTNRLSVMTLNASFSATRR
jgi:hypothetical protein